jgi:FMN reductase
MSSVLLLIGSPSRISRSSALANAIGTQLAEHGVEVRTASLRDIPAEDLIAGRWDGEAAKKFAARLAEVDALVVSTPVYKASFSGALKALLDLLPERALAGKIVLPVATAGTVAHLLAVEYALKPVLSALGARHILAGVFASENQIRLSGDELNYSDFDADLTFRVEHSAEHLAELLEHVELRRQSTGSVVTRAEALRCSA